MGNNKKSKLCKVWNEIYIKQKTRLTTRQKIAWFKIKVKENVQNLNKEKSKKVKIIEKRKKKRVDRREKIIKKIGGVKN